jgi:hypothetical protein
MPGEEPGTSQPAPSRGRELFLSEYLAKSNNLIPEAMLLTYRNKVKMLRSKDATSEEEDAFVDDFINSVVNAKVCEREQDIRMYLQQKLAAEKIKKVEEPKEDTQQKPEKIRSTPGKRLDDIDLTPSKQKLSPANQLIEWQDAVPEEEKAAKVKLHELVTTPQKFDGQRAKARRWLDNYVRAASSNSWNDATKAKYFQSFLTGPAIDWYVVAVQTDTGRQPRWHVTRVWSRQKRR